MRLPDLPIPRFLRTRAIPLATMLALLVALLSAPLLAADEQYPLEIDADSWTADGVAGVTMFMGNVEFRHGPLLVRAETVRVYGLDGMSGEFERAIFTGLPVYFRHTPEPGPRTEGGARTMEYHLPDERLRMTKNAWVRQPGQSLNAGFIEYSVANEQVEAAGSVEDEEERERVRFRFEPEEDSDDGDQS